MKIKTVALGIAGTALMVGWFVWISPSDPPAPRLTAAESQAFDEAYRQARAACSWWTRTSDGNSYRKDGRILVEMSAAEMEFDEAHERLCDEQAGEAGARAVLDRRAR